MRATESLSAFGSFVRTVIGGLLIGAVGYAGGWVYTNFAPGVRLQQKEYELSQARAALEHANQQVANQTAMIQQLDQDLADSQRRIDQLDTSLRLLKVTERVAELRVLRQEQDPGSDLVVTEFQFVEVDNTGNPLGTPRTIRILGDLVYVDYWVIKFEDHYIESAQLDRATSLCLFRRIFGEYQEPYEGFTLDEVGTRPEIYGRGPTISEFERRIWDDFWDIAQDPQRAADLGIRAAHGQAVATRLRPHGHYSIRIRASDGLTITPVGQSVALQMPEPS